MDPRELVEWQIVDEEIDPFGETRADLRAGITCSTIHGMAGRIAKKPLPPSEFMPFLGKPPREPQTAAEQQMICATVAAALGQTVSKPLPQAG